jgi:uncharacterized protein (DUF433 family)
MEPTAKPRTTTLETTHIVRTPGICGGKPRIDGHRIKVEHIAICHERMGMSPDEIVTCHPTINLAQVLIQAEDEQQSAFGLAENRVIFTHDAEFLRLQAAEVQHAGVVYRAKDTLSLGEMIKRLVLIWEVYEPHELVNHVEFI